MTQIKLPKHVAIIMDGNGRWAKDKQLPRIAGYEAGIESLRKIIKSCLQKNIQVLSLFAFSSENWQRPANEVNELMDLFILALKEEIKILHDNNIQLRFIGDRSRFSPELTAKIAEVEKLTAKNSGMILIIAADYGGQWDICQAACKLAEEIEAGRLTSQEITADLISTKLSFADLPDPDLFIRTSGELRISNFMLWQLAYAELYFTNVLWPDFNEEELAKALDHYAGRERRYGLSSEQINKT